MFLNGLGAFATGITLIVVLIAKFTSGGWITALLFSAIILLAVGIKKLYARVGEETAELRGLNPNGLERLIVVLPVARWDKISEKAIRFGLLMGDQIKIINV